MRTPVRVPAIAVVTAAVVAMMLGACSSSSSKSSGTTTTRAVNADGIPKSSKALESLIVTKVPSAFVKQPPEAYDTGPSDLAKAAKDDGEPNAEKLLRSEKFVRGYQRIWIGPEHAQIIVFLYQFESTAGAGKDFARTARAYNSKPPPGAHRFVIPGLPAGKAVGAFGTAKDGAAALVFFTKGVFAVEINVNGARPAGLQASAVAIAKDQYRRL